MIEHHIHHHRDEKRVRDLVFFQRRQRSARFELCDETMTGGQHCCCERGSAVGKVKHGSRVQPDHVFLEIGIPHHVERIGDKVAVTQHDPFETPVVPPV